MLDLEEQWEFRTTANTSNYFHSTCVDFAMEHRKVQETMPEQVIMNKITFFYEYLLKGQRSKWNNTSPEIMQSEQKGLESGSEQTERLNIVNVWRALNVYMQGELLQWATTVLSNRKYDVRFSNIKGWKSGASVRV